MVTWGKRLSPGMVVLLPGRDLITVTLSELDYRAHGIGPDDPSPFSSDDESSVSNDSHTSAVREATLREFAERARGRGLPRSSTLWERRANDTLGSIAPRSSPILIVEPPPSSSWCSQVAPWACSRSPLPHASARPVASSGAAGRC